MAGIRPTFTVCTPSGEPLAGASTRKKALAKGKRLARAGTACRVVTEREANANPSVGRPFERHTIRIFGEV